MSVLGVFLVRIFPHLDWTRRDTEYLSVFSLNAGKYGPEELRRQTLFTQCFSKSTCLQTAFSLKNINIRKLLLDIMHYSKILLTFSLSPAFTLVIGAMKKCNNQQSDEGRSIITNCVLLTIKPPRLSAKMLFWKFSQNSS